MLEQKQIWIIVLLFFCQHASLGEGTSKHSHACEGNSLTLKCDHGFIHVDKANYGRTSSTVCSAGKPANQISNVHCSQITTLQKLSTGCNGKASCSVPALNSVFSDPCVGTYKYLDVSYSCVQKKSVTCEGKQSHIHCASLGERTSKHSHACEGSSLALKCDHGFIHVDKANYGRTSSTVCSAGKPANQISNVHCSQITTLQKLSTGCNGKASCSVPALNSVFSDPCVGTYKYLDVSYSCVQSKKSVTCEGKQSHIHCDTGVIHIQHANYGRRDLKTCAHKLARTANCYSHNTEHHLSSCNGKRKCSLHASSSVFGDPCHGVHKYLEVTYSCVAEKHHKNHHHHHHHHAAKHH